MAPSAVLVARIRLLIDQRVISSTSLLDKIPAPEAMIRSTRRAPARRGAEGGAPRAPAFESGRGVRAIRTTLSGEAGARSNEHGLGRAVILRPRLLSASRTTIDGRLPPKLAHRLDSTLWRPGGIDRARLDTSSRLDPWDGRASTGTNLRLQKINVIVIASLMNPDCGGEGPAIAALALQSAWWRLVTAMPSTSPRGEGLLETLARPNLLDPEYQLKLRRSARRTGSTPDGPAARSGAELHGNLSHRR